MNTNLATVIEFKPRRKAVRHYAGSDRPSLSVAMLGQFFNAAQSDARNLAMWLLAFSHGLRVSELELSVWMLTWLRVNCMCAA